jgi:hypothetical protein
MLGVIVVENGVYDINKQIKQGRIILTDDKILNDETEKQSDVDAVTAPTMGTLFRIKSKEYLEQKRKSKE